MRELVRSRGFLLFSSMLWTAGALLQLGQWHTVYTVYARGLFPEMGTGPLWKQGAAAALTALAAVLGWVAWARSGKKRRED